MMNYPLISVIVPVYNAAKTLEVTIGGLINQTYKNLEIILVDDGSTDNSLKVCRSLADSDNRIKVIPQKNGGVSAARNAGLKYASGEYIGFCDADDFPCPTMFERLLGILNDTSCDAVHMDFITQYEDKKNFGAPCVSGEVSIKSSDKSVKWLLTKKSPHGTGIWEHLFKRSVLSGIEFPEGMAIAEDKMFMLLAFLKCEKVAFYSGMEYIYVVSRDSAMHVKYSKKNLSSVILAERTVELINSEYPQYSEYANVNLYKTYISNIRNIFCFDLKDAEMNYYYKKIISFLKQTKPAYLKNYLSKRELMEYCLIRTGVPIYKLYIRLKKFISVLLHR